MTNRLELNKNLAQMLKGGVIMDVTTPEQAKIAEAAGACAVMALERIPADIRAAGGVSRMSDPKMIKGIQQAVSIPVIAKPNAGMPQIDDLGNAVYSMTPADFAGYMKVLVDNGASVIGGCCGTTPEFISETAQVLGLR